jgi:hypothetical protein
VRLALRLLSQPAPALDGPPRCAIPWTLVRQVATRRSVLLWFGPFVPAALPAGWRELQRRYQVIGVRADDPWDQELPAAARFAAYDPLSGRVTSINTASAAQRAAHRHWCDERDAHLRHLFPHLADRIRIGTDEDPLAVLVSYFHHLSGSGRKAL